MVGALDTTAIIGMEFPDAVVGERDQNYRIEIKYGLKTPNARKLTSR
jgi:hypothetical protein